jgi:hypothetical protein
MDIKQMRTRLITEDKVLAFSASWKTCIHFENVKPRRETFSLDFLQLNDVCNFVSCKAIICLFFL